MTLAEVELVVVETITAQFELLYHLSVTTVTFSVGTVPIGAIVAVGVVLVLFQYVQTPPPV